MMVDIESEFVRGMVETIGELKELKIEMLRTLEGLVERIDRNGGLGEYRGGPAFVMKRAREIIEKAKE